MRAAAGAMVAIAALTVLLAAAPCAGGLEISGSVTGSLGYVALRNSLFYPDAHYVLPDFAAFTSVRVAAEAGEASRLSLEARCTLDAADGSLDFELLRAYAEAKIGEILRFGIGRRLVGFGCGLIWNPVNALDPPRNPFDRSAPRPGLDGAFARLDFGAAAGFPLSFCLQVIPPPFEAGIDASESTVAAQSYLYVAGLELGVVGSCADPAGDRPRWSAGLWGTVDLAGLVLGVETAWGKSDLLPRPDAAGLPVADADPHLSALATASLRRGDFFLYIEGLYSGAGLSTSEAQRIRLAPSEALPAYALVSAPGAIGAWHAAAGFEWSRGDLGFGLGALLDLEELAGGVSGSASWAVDDTAVLRLQGIVPWRLDRISEYDFFPYSWTVALSVEAYF
jgi:hypothetical protein